MTSQCSIAFRNASRPSSPNTVPPAAAGVARPRPPYQQREGIRLVIAKVQISEDGLEISIHRRPASEEVLETLDGGY